MSLDSGGACRPARRSEEGEPMPLLLESAISASMGVDTYRNLVWLGFGLGALFGLTQAVASPAGWLWITIRALVSLLWLIGVVGWLFIAIRERRSHRRRAS
jgi:hypothetical protein